MFQHSDMSELDSDYMNYTEKKGKRIEREVEIYDSADALTDNGNTEETEATDVKESLQTEHTLNSGRQALKFQLLGKEDRKRISWRSIA